MTLRDDSLTTIPNPDLGVNADPSHGAGGLSVPITEHTINDALASVLRGGRHAWRSPGVVHSETTGMLTGGAGRPDILVLEPDVSPVAIETEVVPAVTVEPEARSRLGSSIKKNGRTILSSIALKLPKRLRDFTNGQLKSQLLTATDLEMALFIGGSPDTAKRWPLNQWITGTVTDLSLLTQSASVPPEIVDQAADELINGISAAAGLFAECVSTYAGAISKISHELRQENGEQTWRMACAILANAFVFHESLAGGPGKLGQIRSIEELKSEGGLTKAEVLDQWRKILEVNYWSIFDIARRILELTPSSISKAVITTLTRTATKLLEHRLMRSHDLTGAVFQKLIADRKFLAAFYTTPPSAALLAGLAIREDLSPAGTSWKQTDALRHMRVADFACGTGTLLSAAYQRIGQFHEIAGGDASQLHSYMMGGSLVGCDVLPAAAHLTAATLASVHPTHLFTESSILTLAYGRRPGGGVALGSWDLLDAQREFEILAITAKAAQGTGEVTQEIWSSLPHYGFDLVIMNPPFTRPTGHEGEKIGVRNPMFAAFQADAATQQLMARSAARLSQGTAYHGNAGEGSIFLVLADRKLKQGGSLAMVLPLSFMVGDAWQKSRELVQNRYGDLILVSNAGSYNSEVSFSSDTGMAECLLVGRKNSDGSKRATFVTVNERPDSTMTGTNIAVQIRRAVTQQNLRKLEDGPVGGNPLLLGNEVIGQAIDAPLKGGWGLARVKDFSLAQSAFQLAKGRVWLAGMKKAQVSSVPISTVSNLGSIGPYHADINGRTQNGGIRGPFDIHPAPKSGTSTYPVLWAHDAEREYSICFPADCEAIPFKAKSKAEQTSVNEKVENVWAAASHCHFNVNFQFNSQATSMQYTRRQTLGGRAWLSIKLKSADKEKALVMWANTSLGLLLHWWYSNRQQIGRGNIGKSILEDLAVLDVDKLTEAQLAKVNVLFDKFAERKMLPLHKMDEDHVRAELDEAMLTGVLGLPQQLHEDEGPLQLLRMKLSNEPSIVGHKHGVVG